MMRDDKKREDGELGCVFGNNRRRSPRGMLMRERPFSRARTAGAELEWALLTNTRPQKRGESQGEGSLGGSGK